MFSDVLNVGLVTSVNVDTNQSEKLLRLLDTVVIKLEGGTDDDLKVLDEKPTIENRPEPAAAAAAAAKESLSAAAASAVIVPPILPKNAASIVADGTTKGDESNDIVEDSNDVKEIDVNESNDAIPSEKSTNAEEKASKKRKRTTSGSSSSSSSSTSTSGKFRKCI